MIGTESTFIRKQVLIKITIICMIVIIFGFPNNNTDINSHTVKAQPSSQIYTLPPGYGIAGNPQIGYSIAYPLNGTTLTITDPSEYSYSEGTPKLIYSGISIGGIDEDCLFSVHQFNWSENMEYPDNFSKEILPIEDKLVSVLVAVHEPSAQNDNKQLMKILIPTGKEYITEHDWGKGHKTYTKTNIWIEMNLLAPPGKLLKAYEQYFVPMIKTFRIYK